MIAYVILLAETSEATYMASTLHTRPWWDDFKKESEVKEQRVGPRFLKETEISKFSNCGKWCGREDSNLHGIATASPSSWCVCQFRHYRISQTC